MLRRRKLRGVKKDQIYAQSPNKRLYVSYLPGLGNNKVFILVQLIPAINKCVSRSFKQTSAQKQTNKYTENKLAHTKQYLHALIFQK